MFLRSSRAVAALMVVLLLSVACSVGGSNNNSGSSNTSPVVFAALVPLTGRATIGTPVLQGATAAMNVINKHGGVMGRPLQVIAGDTASDPVDAVTAWRQLEIQHPVFEVGPTTLEISAVLNLYDPAKLI